jgi:hypothetical protein
MSKLSVIGLIIVILLVFIFIGRRHSIFISGVSGSGTVTTEDRKVSDFTKLKLDGVFKTVITQDGGPASVKVETDQNIQKAVTVANDGETLEITTQSSTGFNNPSRMTVYVNVKDLSSLIDKSVGKVETNGTLKADKFNLENDAVGKMDLHIDVQKLTAKINSVGATVLSGSAATADIDNNSVGKLEAYDLKTDTLTIKNNSVGKVEVYAEKEISIDHNGVGSLHYRGNAILKNLRDNGVGKVSKAD